LRLLLKPSLSHCAVPRPKMNGIDALVTIVKEYR